MRNHIKTNRAFTLVEMLTVIAIIGVLAALLFPAIKNAMLKAETTKAQAAMSGLATAFKAYYTEYGKWPIAYPSTIPAPYAYEDFIVDEKMVALLSGDDVGGTSIRFPTPTLYHPAVDTVFGLPYGSSAAIIQGNPRKIVFLEFKNKDLDPSTGLTQGYFLDPWARHYHFRLDVNYQTQVAYPFDPAGTLVTTVGFLIWSVGPDGQYDRTDVIVPPTPPLVVTSSTKNKDNVKSW